MPGYALHCTLCVNSFETRRAWLSHLLGRKHQDLARREVVRWDEEIKEHVIVVFSSFPVGCLEFLEPFSKGRWFIPSDFVFWEERPRLGFVFLESRNAVTEMLEEWGLEARINGQIVHLKRASDYLQSELDHLLPDASRNENAIIKIETPESLKKSFHVEPTNVRQQDARSRCSESSVSVKAGPHRDSNSMDIDSDHCSHQQDEDTDTSASSDSEPSNLSLVDHQLVKDYVSICEAVEIPDEEDATASDIIEKLEKIFAQQFPFCKLYMFRHRYTKIKYFKHDEFLVYVDCEGSLVNGVLAPNCTTREIFGVNKMLSTLKSRFGESVLPSVMFIPSHTQDKLYSRGHEISGRLFRLKKIPRKPLGLLRLVTDTRFLIEVQTCRLLKYLWKFDRRARPLLILVSYWAQNKEIPFFKLRDVTPEESKQSWRISPEPGAVEWLAMLFLCHKKMIPTPREVLGWPHNALMIYEGPDIGFADNENFVREWKRKITNQVPKENTVEFVLDLIRLVKEFFEFYGELQSGEWILNPKDGEVINKADFFNESLSHAKTKLSAHEVAYIKGIRFKKTSNDDIRGSKVVFLNPLHIAHRFVFDGDKFTTQVCPIIKDMAKVFSYTDFTDVRLESLFSYNSDEYLDFVDLHNEPPNIDSTETNMVDDFGIWDDVKDSQIRLCQSSDDDIPLLAAYELMCHMVELPESEYKWKVNLVATLEKTLERRIPSCKLYMFRYYHLGFQDFPKKELLIFMDYEGKISRGGDWPSMKLYQKNSRTMYPPRVLCQLMNFPDAQPVPEADQPEESEKYGCQFILKGFRFSLVSDARFLVETQTCRLLAHLCTYDSRARPLLIMIKYWAKCNQIQLSSPNRTSKFIAKKSYDFPRAGAELEWLVMVFLFHKTDVPTPRQVQTERLHTPIITSKSGTTDIGFCDEIRLPLKEPDYSEHFITNIVTLAKEFFEFYAPLKHGKWLINTRDAEVISMEKIFATKDVSEFSKLTKDEVNQVYQIPRKQASIVIVQPLYCSKYFPIYKDAFQGYFCDAMERTVERLKDFLNSNAGKVNFKNLLRVRLRMSPSPHLNKLSKGARRRKRQAEEKI